MNLISKNAPTMVTITIIGAKDELVRQLITDIRRENRRMRRDGAGRLEYVVNHIRRPSISS